MKLEELLIYLTNFVPQTFVQLLSMALCVLMMNSSIQVQARPRISSVSLFHGMINSSGKSTVNTSQDRRMVHGAKSEKTVYLTSATQGEHVIAEQFKRRFPKSTKDNQCIKKFDHRLIYNYVFEIPHCKKDCKEKVRFVTFSNGKIQAVAYDCVKS